MAEFQSDLITLEQVINNKLFFNIPIYQRLYVWGKDQIHTLLDDIVTACNEQKNEFYLGGTLVIKRPNLKFKQGQTFDLIDGQQRFTTLWLISVVLKNSLIDYIQGDTELGKIPRISFAIRPQVTQFFEKICREEQASLPEAAQLEDALKEIHAYFDNYTSQTDLVLDKVALADFILTKVQLILTQVPEHTDLNKLFEVINNRGVQLQHHEILKAKLLEKLENHERETYSLLWDACSNMNDYVERNLKATTKIDTVALYEQKISNGETEQEKLACASSVLAALQKFQIKSNEGKLTLEEILTATNDFSTDVNPLDEDDLDLPDRISSIISFSMLLQHVLRIFLQIKDLDDISKISDKDLVQIFDQHWLNSKPSKQDLKGFFQLLWEIRYQFDKHVIKWVLVEEDRQHAIRNLRVNTQRRKTVISKYLQRDSADATPDFAVLQSMLYHSQQMTTQYWLTPLLKFLHQGNTDNALLYLQHLDNHLLCSEAKEPLIERTHKFLKYLWHKEKLVDATVSLDQVHDNGTQYPHYWFYKLEYVLYLKLKEERSPLVDDYRVTSKNSVEHVTPQNPRIKQDAIPDILLHRFGNLALVTGKINSEMTDDGFSIKKAKFIERHHGKGVSLKLEDVYSNAQWKENEIKHHHQKMIDAFNLHLKSVTDKTTELINE
ncbi:DUF262 domain-containing protein [Vibrio atypicus]|uniref:DUF262 domain-containing protein n=1 Tax=Vibrio atypicus TaxID=558271 RepID=UPI0037353198